MSEIEERWEEIKEKVRDQYDISVYTFDIFVKPLKIQNVENYTVNIAVPSDNMQFIVYLNKGYKDYFKVVISEMFNHEYEIVFDLEKNLKKQETQPLENNEIYNINYENANLNPRYTFDTFVVGNNNKMARAAATAVADSPGNIYNPLFIYGGPGLGKTHLMHAIGHYIIEHFPQMKVLYVDSEEFTNEIVDSIRSGDANSLNKIREKYRSVDVLMVDDVQFIIGKEKTQEEFFHTFNALHSAGKQIILSSDQPPKKMETLEERFKSRFEWGLITDIQSPDYETRMAILMKNAKNYDVNIDPKIFEFIASNIKTNIRELEGALKKIVAYTKLNNVELTLSSAEEALRDLINPDKPVKITPSYIVDIVAEHYNISSEMIYSKKRTAEIAYPRQVVMYLCCEMTDCSLNEISKLLGKDHTTIMHGRDKIKEDIQKNEEIASKIAVLKSKISTN